MTLCRNADAIQHLGSIVELDIGELRHAIDRQEHVQLAVSQAQLAVIEVDIADRCLCELAPLRSFLRRAAVRYRAVPGSGGQTSNGSNSVALRHRPTQRRASRSGRRRNARSWLPRIKDRALAYERALRSVRFEAPQRVSRHSPISPSEVANSPAARDEGALANPVHTRRWRTSARYVANRI